MLEKNPVIDFKQLNALALAYMGDSVLDMHVRRYLISQGKVRPVRLHKEATRFVSAKAQSVIVKTMMEEEFFTEEELAVFKRGRNAKSGTIPKNTDINTYRHSTGFEAVLGYHYLQESLERLKVILNRSVSIIEEMKNDRKE